jgi:hypothetical protein
MAENRKPNPVTGEKTAGRTESRADQPLAETGAQPTVTPPAAPATPGAGAQNPAEPVASAASGQPPADPPAAIQLDDPSQTRLVMQPERATHPTMRPATVPLNSLVLKAATYCHRDLEELEDRDRLSALKDSLTVEGQLTAVEFFRDSDGKPVVTRGHRRISALRQLAKENRAGFTHDMPVEAVEVIGASELDLLCRSVSDNAIRQDYTLGERIRAAKRLHDAGVEAGRAARALNLGAKQFGRDLRIAQHEWMLVHVEQDHIGHTAACDLLEAAAAAERVTDLETHLDEWVAAKQQEVGQKKKVKSLLGKDLTDHWGALLEKKEPLDDNVVRRAQFQADIDADANRITVGGSLNLLNAPLSALEDAEAKLAAMQKVVAKYRTARGAVEGAQGPQDLAREEARQLELLAKQREEPARPPDQEQATASTDGTTGATEGT